mmetsp:Transcript_4951/g.12580  ORF Transcript_4951/g.12580 Transcript_4951/m.12580 type:complete len:93 (-) Transcript_4951:633-911(-)
MHDTSNSYRFADSSHVSNVSAFQFILEFTHIGSIVTTLELPFDIHCKVVGSRSNFPCAYRSVSATKKTRMNLLDWLSMYQEKKQVSKECPNI